jgi:acyl carrier protein
MIEEIRELILEQLDVEREKITLDSRFVEDLGADSLDLMELASSLEEEYGVSIDKEELKKIVKVGDVVELITDKKG